ncbi:MAG: GH3 family domain-containing protein, partial [Candidatus Nanoarchaeia archaeon]
YFATTSATTSQTKTIPITKQRKRQLNKELVLWMFFVLKKFKNVLNGKLLYFAGPPFEGITEGGIPQGSISGYMATQRPWFTKNKLVIPPNIYNEKNFDKKTKIIARLALKTKNITQIGFFAPIEAILFFEYIENNKEELIDFVKKVKPKRAKELEKLKIFSPKNIWPKLGLINCIKSDNQIPYLTTLRKIIGDKKIKIRDPGIYASEGRLSLGITKYDRAGIIVATENFFEFAQVNPKGSYKKPILINQVEKGKKYKIIMTTTEGLYRYDMGDIVEVIDFKKKLPIIQFVTRDNFLNIAGELAPEKQLINSMKEVIKRTKVVVLRYMFTPEQSVKKKPNYLVIIETDKKYSEKKLKEFSKELDNTLQKNINDYKQMRNEFGRLGHLKLGLVKKESFKNFDKRRLQGSGQPKPIIIGKNQKIQKEFELIKIII